MRGIWLVVMALATLTSASDLHIDKEKLEEAIKTTRVGQRNTLVEDILLDLLEQIRKLMLEGSETFPILDPLKIGAIEIDENLIGTPGTFIKIGDTQVEKLSTFVTETLTFKMEGLLIPNFVLNLDAHIPEITVDTDNYDLSLKIFGGDIYGSGTMSLKIVKPRLTVGLTLTVSFNNGIFLNIKDCNIGVSLGDFQPVIKGLWNSEVASEFISRFLGNLIPELMTYFEVEINDFLGNTVKTIGNDILSDLNILDLIRPKSEENML